jgi:hypothetical protein
MRKRYHGRWRLGRRNPSVNGAEGFGDTGAGTGHSAGSDYTRTLRVIRIMRTMITPQA